VTLPSAPAALWSTRNRLSPDMVAPDAHLLAWWRCPTGDHPDWRAYIDDVVAWRAYCGRCGSERFVKAVVSKLNKQGQGRSQKRGKVKGTAQAKPTEIGRCGTCQEITVLVQRHSCARCLLAKGYLPCPTCGRLYRPEPFDKRRRCPKCRKRSRPRSTSVRTVSGGLPTLGRRR
jgi:Probable Zinc-ribbon domain